MLCAQRCHPHVGAPCLQALAAAVAVQPALTSSGIVVGHQRWPAVRRCCQPSPAAAVTPVASLYCSQLRQLRCEACSSSNRLKRCMQPCLHTHMPADRCVAAMLIHFKAKQCILCSTNASQATSVALPTAALNSLDLLQALCDHAGTLLVARLRKLHNEAGGRLAPARPRARGLLNLLLHLFCLLMQDQQHLLQLLC